MYSEIGSALVGPVRCVVLAASHIVQHDLQSPRTMYIKVVLTTQLGSFPWAGPTFRHTLCPKNETRLMLNILYSRKSVAMKFSI